MAPRRSASADSKVSERVVNQILTEMDGLEELNDVVVIAATNRPDVLDPALLRPGRFDRQVVIDRPDLKGREEILKVHVRDIKLNKSVKLNSIARQTSGFSGADLANLVNEAALLANTSFLFVYISADNWRLTTYDIKGEVNVDGATPVVPDSL